MFTFAVKVMHHLDGINVRLSEVEVTLARQVFSFRNFAKAVNDAVMQVGYSLTYRPYIFRLKCL